MVYLLYLLCGLLAVLGIMWVGWSFYLAAMTLKRVRKANKLSKSAKFFGAPVEIVTISLNTFINVVFLTVLLLDWPQERFVSHRMNRLIKTDEGWRGRLALWFRADMLDYLDPDGPHR